MNEATENTEDHGPNGAAKDTPGGEPASVAGGAARAKSPKKRRARAPRSSSRRAREAAADRAAANAATQEREPPVALKPDATQLALIVAAQQVIFDAERRLGRVRAKELARRAQLAREEEELKSQLDKATESYRQILTTIAAQHGLTDWTYSSDEQRFTIPGASC